MAVMSSKSTVISISTTAGGTYAPIGKVLSVTVSEQSGTDSEIYVFADTAPIPDAGDETNTITLPVLWDLADAQQDILRAARRSGATIYARFLPGGLGIEGEQRPIQVKSFSWDSDPNGTGAKKYVNGSFTFQTAGPVTVITPT